jgi:hypothetical protein
MRRQLPGSHKPFRLIRDSDRELAREQARRRLRRQPPPAEDTPIDDELTSPAGRTGIQSIASTADRLARTASGSDCCRIDPGDLSAPTVLHQSSPDEGSMENRDKEASSLTQAAQSGSGWPFEGGEPEATHVASQTAPDTPSSLIFGELATAYVPWQMFGQTLSLRDALRTGTLFPELVRNVPLYQKPPGT